jgi:hypothetical protein
MALFLMGLGAYYLIADKDSLWERQQRHFRAQGIVNREKTPEWERAQEVSGGLMIAGGVLVLIIGGVVFENGTNRASQNPHGARYYINGREVSRQEAERSGIMGVLEAENKK